MNSVAANEFEVRGNIELQNRYFIEDPLFPTQENNYLSVAAAPEFFWSWNNGDDSFDYTISDGNGNIFGSSRFEYVLISITDT